MFVNGVGDHIPGYTTQFQEKLDRELNLSARSEGQKHITLTSPLIHGKKPGNLRVSYLFNEETGKDLTLYELNWSEITRPEKELLAFDNSGEYDCRRVKIDSLLKKIQQPHRPRSHYLSGPKSQCHSNGILAIDLMDGFRRL